MKFKLYESLQNNTRKRVVYNFKRRIDRLFEFMEQNIGQNPIVWEGKTSYLEVILEYLTEMYKHYRKLHQEGKLDLNDVIDGYET